MEGLPRDPGPADPTRLRISDADRHAVAEVLRHAAGEGRIDLDELDERLEAAYAAKTYADLVPLTVDLPVAGVPMLPGVPPVPAVPAMPPAAATSRLPTTVGGPTYASSFSVMSECSRRGVWQVPPRHSAFSFMGSVNLDLREARFSAAETVIEAYAIMAGIEIVVNPWTRVVVEGVGVMGDFSEARSRVAAELGPDSPLVRVRGLALMAGVTVKRKAMPGESRKLLGRG